MNKLKAYMRDCIEAGVDEAGRGCLAGPVVAAAVILPQDFDNPLIKDSKKLNKGQLEEAYEIVIEQAISWSVFQHSAEIIDKYNILNATIMAMHGALESLNIMPEHIIVDGNQFRDYYSTKSLKKIPHTTIVKGDSKYYSIAAASIIAKVTRDKIMRKLALSFPDYGWHTNMGYATQKHCDAIKKYGISEWHRKSFLGSLITEIRSKPLF